jgi:hypothetical protein
MGDALVGACLHEPDGQPSGYQAAERGDGLAGAIGS